MAMLVIILFILNLLTIFAVVLLYQRQNRLTELEANLRKGVQDSEELLSSFMMEMKEENEVFLAKIRAVQSEVPSKPAAAREKGESLSAGRDEELAEVPQASYQKMLAARAYKPPEKPEPAFEELPFEEQVFLLAEEGMPAGEIAKKLKKGKTEIELLLKFRKK